MDFTLGARERTPESSVEVGLVILHCELLRFNVHRGLLRSFCSHRRRSGLVHYLIACEKELAFFTSYGWSSRKNEQGHNWCLQY